MSSTLEVHAQTRIAEEVKDLRSYLNGIPAELRKTGAFSAYEARLNELSEQLLDAEYDEKRLDAEITDLAAYVDGLPDNLRGGAAFASYHTRLGELQNRLLALRLSRIASRYAKQLALPSPATRKMLTDPGQMQRFTEWCKVVQTTHERTASRYLHTSLLLNALVALSGAAAGVGAFTASAVFPPLGFLAAAFAILQLAFRPGERSRHEQRRADRIETIRWEIETLQHIFHDSSEFSEARNEHLQHTLQLLDHAHLE